MIFALDIGGTFTKYALIDDNKIMHKGSWQTLFDRQSLLKNIDRHIPSNLDYIAISSGGFWENNRSIGYETIPDTADGEFIKDLQVRYQCEVFIQNDARCAMLCESERGVLRGVDNAVVFLLGSSLGCAVKINGKIVNGSTGQCASMFAMPETLSEEVYTYNHYANSVIQIEKYKEISKLEKCDMLVIEQDAISGNQLAIKIIKEYANTIALKCWYAYLMYDPECIVFGGGISNSKLILDLVIDCANKYFAGDVSKRKLKIVMPKFGQDSNLIGASLLRRKV